MDIHKNARLTLRSREDLVHRVSRGVTLKRAAARFNVTAKTAAKWVHRYRALGAPGLLDRSSRTFVQPHDILYKLSLDILYTPGARSAPGWRKRWLGRRWMCRSNAYGLWWKRRRS